MKDFLKRLLNPVKKETSKPSKQQAVKPGYMPIERAKYSRPVITASVILPNGKAVEMPIDKSINDGNCLICDCSEYYHTVAGCYLKWNETDRRRFDNWRLVPIASAKKQGYLQCLICAEKR